LISRQARKVKGHLCGQVLRYCSTERGLPILIGLMRRDGPAAIRILTILIDFGLPVDGIGLY